MSLSVFLGVGIYSVFFIIIYLSGTIPSNSLLLGLSLIAFFISLMNLKNSINKKMAVNYIFIFILFLYALITVILRDSNSFDPFSISITHRLLFLFLYLPLFIIITLSNANTIKKAIRIVLSVNVFFWFLQFSISYFTGDFFDILSFLGLREQRGSAYIFNHLSFGFKLFRPTGLLHEPGTYASVVIQLLILDYFSHGKKICRLHQFTLASFFLSMSGFSILLGFSFILFDFASKNNIKMATKIKLLSVILIVFSASAIYASMRFTENYRSSGLEFRVALVDKVLNQDVNKWLFGHKLNDTEVNAGKTGNYTAYIEDLSFGFYLFYHFGVFYLLFFLGVLLRLFDNWKLCLFAICILLSKINIASYFLWFTLCTLNSILNNAKENKVV